MKRLMIALGTIVTALYLASLPALAQGRPGGGSVGASHGPSSHASSTARGSSTSTGPKSADSLLTSNSNLANHLTNALIKSGALAPGSTRSTLISDCNGFSNLGRCISAIHVAHNRNLDFFCLRKAMTGVALPSTDTTTCNITRTNLKLGQAIQALDPNADPKAEASKAIKQGNADIKSAKS